MSAGDAYRKVAKNDASMANGLPSTQVLKTFDHCCGIHGAAKERRGIKRGTSAARRRYEKELISKLMSEE